MLDKIKNTLLWIAWGTLVVLCIFFYTSTLKKDARIAELSQSLITIDASKAVLETIINDQNTKISEMTANMQDIDNKSTQLLSDLDNMRLLTNTEAARILATDAPETCVDSIQTLRNVEDLSW